jgi:hypothetical protein
MVKILTLNRLETHDRLQHLKKQDFDIGECCQNLINQRPFGDHAFYIFVHARTVGLDEKMEWLLAGTYKNFSEIPEKRIIWQPRLTKPKAQPNSMLFKAKPGSDDVRTIWIIPDQAMWGQYEKGKVTESETILQSIRDFTDNREWLERKEDDDLDDEAINTIYRQISMSKTQFRKV